MLLLLPLCLALGAAADRDGVAASVAGSATELKVMAKGHVSAHGHHKSHHQGRPKEEDHSAERNAKVQRIMDAMEGHGSLPRKHLDHYSPELAAQMGNDQEQHEDVKLVQVDTAPRRQPAPPRRLQRDSLEQTEEQHEGAKLAQVDVAPRQQPAPPRRLQRDSLEQTEEADYHPPFEKLSLVHPSSEFAHADDSHRSETPPRPQTNTKEEDASDAIEDYKKREEDARRGSKNNRLHDAEEDADEFEPDEKQQKPIEDYKKKEEDTRRDAKNEKKSRLHDDEEDMDEFEPHEKQQKPTLLTEAVHSGGEKVAEHSEHSGHPRFGDIDMNGDGFIDGIEFQNAVAKGKLKS